MTANDVVADGDSETETLENKFPIWLVRANLQETVYTVGACATIKLA